MAAAFAFAQPAASQNSAAECGRLAGSPNEPNNPDKIGVELHEIDTERAIKACNDALGPQAIDPVAAYRLSRAYMAIGPHQDVRYALYLQRIVWGDGKRSAGRLGAEAAAWYATTGQQNLTPATYEKAAEGGSIFAQMILAYLHTDKNLNALKQEPDLDTAIAWMQRAADQDYPPAQFGLGMLLSWKNRHEEAFEWYRRAAKRNWEPAIHSLGLAYAYGTGTSQDGKRGIEYLSKVANAGNVGAQIALGHLFLKGVGTEPNPQLARRWYKMAADNGSQEAVNLLKQTANYGDISDEAALAILAGLGLIIFFGTLGGDDTPSGSSPREESQSCEPCVYGERMVFGNQCQNMDTGALRSPICRPQ